MGRTYEELNKHAKDARCVGCPLFGIGASFARTDGSGRNGVALVGEALGESEALAGKPFVGDSGYMLNQILHRGAFKRDDFLVLNSINCHPANNYLDGAPYEAGALAHCNTYFDEALEKNKHVKVLVPMGNTALFKLLGQRGIKNWHGTIHWNERYGRWVVPTLHPSAILRGGGKEFPTALFDIRRATELARTQQFERSPVDYILRPTLEQFERYIDDYERWLAQDPTTILAADIETNYSSDIDEEDLLEKDTSYDITRISFSYKPNTAITLPFTSDYTQLVMRLLSTNGTVCFWNGNKFDVPRLLAAGMSFQGLIIDGMDAWHVLRPDLPKGLGYVSPFFTDLAPWKHLNNSDPEFYSCVDSDALIRIILKVREMHIKDGTWDTFLKYWASLESRLYRMSEIGIGVNEIKRLERQTHYETIRDHTAEEIQKIVPDTLKPRKKQREGGYRGKPHDVRQYLREHEDINEEDAWRACGYAKFKYPANPLNGATNSEAEGLVWRWDKLLPFNHNSPDQIIDYITAAYGTEAVPRNKKTGRPTTGQEDLERLARQRDDAILNLIIDAANADGKITSFIKPWTPGPDGRVHGIFTNTPATARLASQNPNLQNFPIRSTEAMEMRKMIVPGGGWKYLIEADYSGIEAIMVGWYARDDQYMRLAYRGVHSYLAAKKLGIPVDLSWSDNDLALALKEAKKVAKKTTVAGSTAELYDSCKRTVHGSNYLEGALLLHKTFPELFPTTKAAQADQDFYFELFPKIKPWQQAVVDQCYETCYVENAWRIKRWLFAAKKWVYSQRLGKWELKLGDDGKKAIATIPQGSAGMIMRGALLSDPATELLERGCLMLTIHDSLVARARDEKERDWVIQMLKQTMEYPILEMNGIIIPVEVKTGLNWGEMEEIKI